MSEPQLNITLNHTGPGIALPPPPEPISVEGHHELSNEILTLIFIMIAVYHLNQFLEKFRISKVIQPNMIAVIFGIGFGFLAFTFYSPDTIHDLRRGLPNMFNIFLIPVILFDQIYTMKKDRVILDRFGTLLILAVLPLVVKVSLTTLLLKSVGVFETIRESAIFSIAIYAQNSFNIVNQLVQNDVSQTRIVFYEAACLLFNVITITLTNSLHQVVINQKIIEKVSQRIFFNIFFTMFIGINMAFLSSYSLKSSHMKLETKFDNFDILMMVVPPLVSYLLAESFSISGLIALMTCAFVQSIYAKKNLERGRSHLLERTFRALSYTCRSICDLLIGISFPLYILAIMNLNILHVLASLTIVTAISYFGSFLITLFLIKRKLVAKQEQMVLDAQSCIRGMLALALSLIYYNDHIIAMTIVNVLFSILIVEPIIHYQLIKHISISTVIEEELRDDGQEMTQNTTSEEDIGCFKHCLLNIHTFTLSKWLVHSNSLGGVDQFQQFTDSNVTHHMDNPQVIEMSQLATRSQRNLSRSTLSDTQTPSNQRRNSRRFSSKKLSKSTPASVAGGSQPHDEIALKHSVFQ